MSRFFSKNNVVLGAVFLLAIVVSLCGCGSKSELNANYGSVSENFDSDKWFSMAKLPEGKIYELDEKSKYVYTESTSFKEIDSSGSQFGVWGIWGELRENGSVDGVKAYEVIEGKVAISFLGNGDIVNASEEKWHLINDKSKEINGIKLGSKIQKGAAIIQISNDGINWNNEQFIYDIASGENVVDLYETKMIQQNNGCYYKVIVAYETERRQDGSTTRKKYVEEYKFYIKDNIEDSASEGEHSNNSELLNATLVNAGKDKGYSELNEVSGNDVHSGWEIGSFSVNGYSKAQDENLFIQDSNDKVTLTFNLKQDINCLDGNENLVISSDKNGRDDYFQIEKTDFKHGVLLLQYTDMNGNKSETFMYTDFLNTYAKKGQDILIPLWGTGDYEVALDYEVKNSEGLDSYENYKLYFSFKLRDDGDVGVARNQYYAGRLYELDKKYEYTNTTPYTAIPQTGSQFGTFSISGNLADIDDVDGYDAYNLININETATLCYRPSGNLIDSPETDWHVVEDKDKKINGEKLDGKILKGAIILQTSNDGEKWITDLTTTNIAGSDYNPAFYDAKEIQLINGCYYKVIVAYETERTIEETGKSECKNYVEIYEFYLRNDTEKEITEGQHPKTNKTVSGEAVNTGKDNGFSEENSITVNDPHYGWELGSFKLSGFSGVVDYQGEEIFLKTINEGKGDVITLSFRLAEDIDINCLNGKENLTISNDKNGHDQYFQVRKSEFGRGTLIVRYTDYEGNKTDPIVYKNFLEANARSGADTRIKFFEEGDYEVALDYEIKDSSGLVDKYTNYRIFFTFKIRNGNNMVYAFDNSTQSQLADGTITETGFTINTANSHYLDINVEIYKLTEVDGKKVLDSAKSIPAYDGDSYTAEGKYVVTVKNNYQSTNDYVSKTFFVGTDPYIKELQEEYLTSE